MARIRSIKKLGPDETLPKMPRETFNTVIDLRLVRARQALSFLHRKRNTAPPLANTNIILVKNDSGVDVPTFGILGIDEPIILPSDNELQFRSRVALKCVMPSDGTGSSADDHTERFVITAEPIGNGKIGRAFIAGVCIVRLDSSSSTSQEKFATIIDGDVTQLTASSTGVCEILWRGDGASSEKWAVVRFGAGGGADSAGIRQYQQHVMVTDNEAAWDVARFASLITNGD